MLPRIVLRGLRADSVVQSFLCRLRPSLAARRWGSSGTTGSRGQQAQSSIEYRPLGTTGMNLSIISMGGSGYGNVYGNHDEKESIDAVEYALDSGVNYIDTAYWYGQGASELFLGKALKNIPREKYYIGTKVGRYEVDVDKMFDFSVDKVTKSAEESLQRLQLDYVDLFQIHDVEFAPSVDMIVNETLPALQKLKERGLCRFVGITGYPINVLRAVLERSPVKIDSILSYCRLMMSDPSLTEHFDYFKSKGVPIINASPIGMGLLSPSSPPSWHPASNEIKDACAKAAKHCKEEGVSITRLAVHYSTSFKEVTTTLVSMNNRHIVNSNIDAGMRPLSEKEKKVMEDIIQRYLSPLQQKHWEGVELEDYRRQLDELKRRPQ